MSGLWPNVLRCSWMMGRMIGPGHERLGREFQTKASSRSTPKTRARSRSRFAATPWRRNTAKAPIAVCYPSQPAKNDNLVIAKLRDGAVLFKRVQFADGEVLFHSINPTYKTMKYPERDLAWIYPVGLTQKTEL